jgi:CRP/FNR family transcriptional regulator, cyclic AMP receptor protein
MEMLSIRYSWEPYLSYGQEKIFDKDETIFRQGDKGNGFYYLCKGGIKTLYLSEKGEERIINYLQAGMLFGEDGINNSCYLGTAITISPTTMFYFSQKDYLSICREHPQAAILFINSQISKFREVMQTIKILDSPIEAQIVHYLSKFSSVTMDIPFDQTLLAKELGTSRVTINKVIRKWKNQGVIRVSNRMIHILDRTWLQ